ncbi:protein NO VEIN domain-containing protein [Brachybacterium sp. FME24]|uniref:protein NO VEIN domain-containing protein n=1 Tax=Brachybacterium sp. FME24 TaxID=2742605 RepID=UPI001868A11A|nr:DUF3883 domain-containing protein [Brachybacterium sp. FME24]
MKPPKLVAMSNYETENRAIAYVIAYERAAGRAAVDTHHIPGSLVDVESVDDVTGEKRLIEIKAFGGTGCVDFLWLEPNQVEALEQVQGFHHYFVTNVRSADPAEMLVLGLAERCRRALPRVRRDVDPRLVEREMIADQLLAALPPTEPSADDDAYAAGLRDLLA